MGKIRRILMVAFGSPFSGPQTGGTKRFCELLKYYQDNPEFDVTLCSTENPNDLPENLEHIKLSSNKFNKKGIMPPTYYLYKENKKLLRNIRGNYDYIVAFEATTVYWLSKLNFKNLVMMVRKDLIAYKSIEMDSNNSNILKKKITLKYYKFAEMISLIKARVVLVQCNYDKNQLIDRHKFLNSFFKKKIFVQINNINPKWIVNNSKCEINPKVESHDYLKICYIGNFDNDRKGYKLLLEALEVVKKNNCDIQVIFVGGGKNLEEIKRKYSNYSNYHFLGFVDNPIKILKSCDLTIVPSLADSFPNTVMEGMYNNIPVIASSVGGIPEILNDKAAIFNPDIDSLYNKIMKTKDKSYLNCLKNRQMQRKNELLFDWPEKVSKIIDENIWR